MTTENKNHTNKEAAVSINGIQLNDAQSMSIRVAVASFIQDLQDQGLGDDFHGKAMTSNYLLRLQEVEKLLNG